MHNALDIPIRTNPVPMSYGWSEIDLALRAKDQRVPRLHLDGSSVLHSIIDRRLGTGSNIKFSDVPSPIRMTPWAEFLVDSGRALIANSPAQSLVVDLGAGPHAIVSRLLAKDYSRMQFVAVEPNVDVLAPAGVQILSNLSQLARDSVDLILFNPPASLTSWIDPAASNRFAFDGGPSGIEIINYVIQESMKRLREGGSLLILIPSYHQPILPLDARVEVINWKNDSISTLVDRAPFCFPKEIIVAEHMRMCERNSYFWEQFGVQSPQTHYALVAMKITKLPGDY